MYIQIRMGSACRDLPNLIGGITSANARRCLFCTDDREPGDILQNGHINYNLKLAVELGLDPLTAVSIATLNPAECYGLEGKGAVAPGYDGDIVVVDNLKSFQPRYVFANGQEIAREGDLLVEFPDYVSDKVEDTVHITPLNEQDLALDVCKGRELSAVEVRTIQVIPGSVLTHNQVSTVLPGDNGCFDPKRNPGLNKLAVVERHHGSGRVGLGILSSYGLRNGAIATSVAHDSHNIVVVGDNDRDMLAAIHDIEAMGGGISLCQDGKVLDHLPLPVAGLMSNKPAPLVAENMHRLLSLATETFGICEEIQPLMTLAFMTLPVIPELKLTTNGLFDVNQFQHVDVVT